MYIIIWFSQYIIGAHIQVSYKQDEAFKCYYFPNNIMCLQDKNWSITVVMYSINRILFCMGLYAFNTQDKRKTKIGAGTDNEVHLQLMILCY